MSFQDLESGPRSGGHASKQQPKQRRDEESPFEKNIKNNIRDMQDLMRKASDQLDHAQRRVMSSRMSENFQNQIERCNDLSQKTEELFRDWTVQLAGEPWEKHRKKFSYEKLQKAFEDEVAHLKDLGRRALAAQQEAKSAAELPPLPMECTAMCEDQGAPSPIDDDSAIGLLDDSSNHRQQQEDAGLRLRVAEERAEGIRRIQGQVAEVTQIFHDLASIVQDQGQQFESIEAQAEQSAVSTKQAGQELKKAVDRSRSTRERLCCMIAVALAVLCLVVLPHVQMFSGHHTVHHATAGIAADVASPLDPNFDSSSQWGSPEAP